jgi:hypothetical protein
MTDEYKVSEYSNIVIPLRNLIALLVVTSMAVIAYFNIESRITQIEKDTSVIDKEIEMNSEFRVKWPRGELGSLPDDAEQNIRLMYIERRMSHYDEEFEKIKLKLEKVQMETMSSNRE